MIDRQPGIGGQIGCGRRKRFAQPRKPRLEELEANFRVLQVFRGWGSPPCMVDLETPGFGSVDVGGVQCYGTLISSAAV